MWFVPWDGPDPGQPFSFVVQLARAVALGAALSQGLGIKH